MKVSVRASSFGFNISYYSGFADGFGNSYLSLFSYFICVVPASSQLAYRLCYLATVERLPLR